MTRVTKPEPTVKRVSVSIETPCIHIFISCVGLKFHVVFAAPRA